MKTPDENPPENRPWTVTQIGRTVFRVPPNPAEWPTWTFCAKVAWLQGHASPAMSYGEAVQEMSRRARAARRHRAEMQIRRARRILEGAAA